MTPVDITAQLTEDRLSSSVVNCTVVTDPTIQQPVSESPHHMSSLLNHFWMGQGLHRQGLEKSAVC